MTNPNQHTTIPELPVPISPGSGVPVRRRSLTRRIGLSLLLALLCAVLAGVATWFLTPDRYQSTGVIDIKPFLKRVLFPNEQNMVMPYYDSYVSKQIAIMQQQRCIQFAMESPTWQATINAKSVKRTTLDFTHSLSVGRQGELIILSFVDHEPELAQAGVKAIINSYRQITVEKEDDDMRAKQILENRITENTRLVKATQDRINEITKDFGTDDLTQFYNAWATILNNLDQQIVQRQELLAISQGPMILETQPATSRPSDIALEAVPPATEAAADAAATTHTEQVASARMQLRALVEIRAQAYNRLISGIRAIMRDVKKLWRRHCTHGKHPRSSQAPERRKQPRIPHRQPYGRLQRRRLSPRTAPQAQNLHYLHHRRRVPRPRGASLAIFVPRSQTHHARLTKCQLCQRPAADSSILRFHAENRRPKSRRPHHLPKSHPSR